MSIELVLGIDIGGTLTKIGLVDRDGKIHASSEFKTEATKPFDSFLQRLEDHLIKLKVELQVSFDILAVGVGAPNANAITGQIEHAPNLRWGEFVPLKESIVRVSGLPVVIANDANATAVGELHFGKGKGMKNFIVLTLGTGLGSGIITDGKLFIGEHGMAGEIGHVSIDPEGRQCNCGLKGCLETYASVTGLKRTVFELMAEMNDDSSLKEISFDDMTGEMIAQAALNGDPVALKAFEHAAEVLGDSMANSVAHFDPEAFILTGGLSKAGDLLVEPVRASMERNLFKAYKDRVKIFITDSADASSIHGPAALAWESLSN